MTKEQINKLKAAVEGMRGAADECQTIVYYIERLIATNDDSPEAAEEVKPQYEEIVKDELNHALRFIFNVFVKLSGIEPDMDGLEDI